MPLGDLTAARPWCFVDIPPHPAIKNRHFTQNNSRTASEATVGTVG